MIQRVQQNVEMCSLSSKRQQCFLDNIDPWIIPPASLLLKTSSFAYLSSMIRQRANQNPELIPRFENLLEEWCNQIEEYINPNSRRGCGSIDCAPNVIKVLSSVG